MFKSWINLLDLNHIFDLFLSQPKMESRVRVYILLILSITSGVRCDDVSNAGDEKNSPKIGNLNYYSIILRSIRLATLILLSPCYKTMGNYLKVLTYQEQLFHIKMWLTLDGITNSGCHKTWICLNTLGSRYMAKLLLSIQYVVGPFLGPYRDIQSGPITRPHWILKSIHSFIFMTKCLLLNNVEKICWKCQKLSKLMIEKVSSLDSNFQLSLEPALEVHQLPTIWESTSDPMQKSPFSNGAKSEADSPRSRWPVPHTRSEGVSFIRQIISWNLFSRKWVTSINDIW